MSHDPEASLQHWDDPDVESMYDKHLLKCEIDLVRPHLPRGALMLDAGCGEGEGTVEYAQTHDIRIDAADFSGVRLSKAAPRLAAFPNVRLHRVDFLGEEWPLAEQYDVILTQRLLINFLDWEIQQRVLQRLVSHLRSGGLYLALEGSQQGVLHLNRLRDTFGLPPIPVKFHNLFLDDSAFEQHLGALGCELTAQDGLGAYYMLTRGIRPALDEQLNWDSEFNRAAASHSLRELLGLDPLRFARLKLWVFRRRSS